MDIDMDTQYVPQLPTEVVGVILSKLEVLDALNCRFVSKEWDLECLKTLKNSKFRLNLDQASLKKYLDSDPPQQILPFHLKCAIEEAWDEDEDENENGSGHEGKDTKKDEVEENGHKKPEKKGTTKKDAKHNEDDDGDEDGENYPPMPQYPNHDDDDDDEPPWPPPPNKVFAELRANVSRLVELFGPQCIRDLTFSHPGPYEKGFSQKLSDLLAIISLGLEKLILQIECEFPQSGEFNLFFPNLKILWLRCNKNSEDENNTVWRLIQACPNLEELRLRNISDVHVTGWIDSVPFPPLGLKLLYMERFPLAWFMEKLRTYPSLTKSLQSLELERVNIIVAEEEPDALRDILNLFSTSLKSLSIPITISDPRFWDEDYDEEDDHTQDIVEVPFPLLPMLKNLRIRKFTKGRNHDPVFVIDTEPFPSLESVDLPYDIILNTNDLTLTFPGVKSLTLRVLDGEDFGRRENPPRPYKENMDNFLKIFPGVEKLSIINVGCIGGQGIKFVLKGIVQSKGSAQIKVLELIDCGGNYLGEILEQIQNPPRMILENIQRTPRMDSEMRNIFSKFTGSVKMMISQSRMPDCHTTSILEVNPCVQNFMTNIQKIRVELSAEAKSEMIAHIFDDPEKKLGLKAELGNIKMHLDTMTKNFPQLEEVEISSTIFSTDSISRAQRLQLIKEKFPHLIINII